MVWVVVSTVFLARSKDGKNEDVQSSFSML